MRIATFVTAATLSLTAGLGAVQAASPGLAQLAGTLGVSADDFTTAQLIRLSDAVRENDASEISFILDQAATGSPAAGVGSVPSTTPGAVQLSLIESVEPGQFTLSELQQLSQARKDNNQDAIDYILSGANRETRGGVGEVSPGKAQLAALLGVIAAEYTNAELAVLAAAQQSSDD